MRRARGDSWANSWAAFSGRHAALLLPQVLCPLLLLLPGLARAGAACDERPLAPESIAQAMDLALRTRQALDDSGAQVALVARAGQDLSAYRLRWSHMALAWRDHPNGRWLVVHELNDCGAASSALYNEGLGNFFLDNMFQYQALVVIPAPEMQQRLAAVLTQPTVPVIPPSTIRAVAPRPVPSIASKLHDAHYNMLSYAYSTRYQNSNQWVLETWAAAAANPGQVATRADAQAWLKGAGFQPITVHVPTLTRLGARMFRANVAFDDHPFERRMAGRIDTVTVDAVARFVRQQDPFTRELIVQ